MTKLGISCALLLLACAAGCGAVPEPDDRANEPIIRGTVLTEFADEVVQIRSTRRICTDCTGKRARAPCTGSCSGTLLRNDVVLTAKHCVTEDVSLTGRALAPGEIRVFESKNTSDSEPASQVLLHPRSDVDVALIFLGAGLPVNGRSYGHMTPVFPYDPAVHERQNLIIAGYGLETQTGCGKIDHKLRYGAVQLSDAGDDENPGGAVQRLKWTPLNGQIQSKGDSGSAGFGGLGFPAAALGVLNTCEFLLGMAAGACRSASPDDYRAWVEATLTNRQPAFRDRFERDTSLSYEAPSTSVCAGAPAWTHDSRFQVLVEASGARGCGSDPGGPILLEKFGVYQHALVEVKLSPAMITADDGSVGFVFRYVDADHYYQVLFTDSTNQVTFYVKNGTFTRLASATVDVDWDAFPRIGLLVSGYRFVALYNGVSIGSARDSRYSVGRIGITKRAQAGLVLDDFTIKPLPDLFHSGHWPLP